METTKRPDIVIRAVVASDASGIADIYNHYVSKTVITFEEDEVTDAEMVRRIKEVQSEALPWLVATHNSTISGYAYATKWRARPAYRFSTEITVYVSPGSGRLGIGLRLYEELLSKLHSGGIHAVIGGIALPNEASVALHEKLGFSKVAHFKEVGFKFNRWVDVGYWQRNF
jgi:L-amino acid N-acyltransferase YncA